VCVCMDENRGVHAFFCAANTPPDIKVMRVVCVCVCMSLCVFAWVKIEESTGFTVR
jgi:hypothetical protein